MTAAAAVVRSLFTLHPGTMISNISNDASSDVFSVVLQAPAERQCGLLQFPAVTTSLFALDVFRENKSHVRLNRQC